MPGNPSLTFFRTAGDLASGVSVSGNAVSLPDESDPFTFTADVSGAALCSPDSPFAPAVTQVVAGENVLVVGLHAQQGLFQDGADSSARGTGVVGMLVDKLFAEIKGKEADGKMRVEISMVDVVRNKCIDLLNTAGGGQKEAVRVSSSDAERGASLVSCARLALASPTDAQKVIQGALARRAHRIAGSSGGQGTVAHTVTQIYWNKVGDATQKSSTLSILSLIPTADESFLGVSALCHEFANGNRKYNKHKDNVLCQLVKTSLGGSAHAIGFAEIGGTQGSATVGDTELTVKTLGAIAAIKDTASSKDFSPDPALADDAKWAERVQQTQQAATTLWPPQALAGEAGRGSTPHLLPLHRDVLVDSRNTVLLEAGSKRAGREDAKIKQDIILHGLGIQAEHCVLKNMSAKLTIIASAGAGVSVNGTKLEEGKEKTLEHNDRVRLGAFQTFRVVVPGKASPADQKFDIAMAEKELQSASSAQAVAGIDITDSQQDKIEKLLPMVNEANHIAEDLKKDVSFLLKMVAAQGGSGSDVQVQVTYGGSQESLWEADTFLDRVYEMRDIYDQFVARGRDLMYVNSTYTGAQDPFAQQTGEGVVGRAMIYLDAVNHLLPVHETTPIIDYKGFSRGELKVDVELQLPNVDEKEMAAKFDELERVEKLKGKQLRINVKVAGIRGLPSNMCEDSFVTFRFFLDEKVQETPKAPKKTINPKFNFEHSWNLVVTDELCKYLSSDVLEFIVYAKSSALEGGASKEAEAAAAAAAPDDSAKIDEDTLQQLHEKEEQLQELKFQLTEQKLEMERKMREAKGGPGASGPSSDGKTESVEDLKEHIEFLEQKIESLESQKKELQSELQDRDDELAEANQQIDGDEETMQQQLSKIQELEQELAEAKKSKACVIL